MRLLASLTLTSCTRPCSSRLGTITPSSSTSRARASVLAVLGFFPSLTAVTLTRSRLIPAPSWGDRRLGCSSGWRRGVGSTDLILPFRSSVTASTSDGVPTRQAWWCALRRPAPSITVRPVEGGNVSRIWPLARTSPTVSPACAWSRPVPVTRPAPVSPCCWPACGDSSFCWSARPLPVLPTSGEPAGSCGRPVQSPARCRSGCRNSMLSVTPTIWRTPIVCCPADAVCGLEPSTVTPGISPTGCIRGETRTERRSTISPATISPPVTIASSSTRTP